MYIIQNQIEEKSFNAFISGKLLDEEDRIFPYIFNFGRSIEDYPNLSLKLIADRKHSMDGKFPDHLVAEVYGNFLFLANEKLTHFLTDIAGAKIEICPLRIIRESESISGYSIVNFLEVVNCIDHQESDLIYTDFDYKEVHSIKSLKIKPKTISPNIFLLGETRPQILLVSPFFYEEYYNRGISGLQFTPVDEFHT